MTGNKQVGKDSDDDFVEKTNISGLKHDLTTARGVVEFQFNSVLQLHGVTETMLENSE